MNANLEVSTNRATRASPLHGIGPYPPGMAYRGVSWAPFPFACLPIIGVPTAFGEKGTVTI